MSQAKKRLRALLHYLNRIGRCLAGNPVRIDSPSFAAAMSYQTHLRTALASYAGTSVEGLINSKKPGFDLAHALGVNQPLRHVLGEPLQAVRFQPKTVIKPLSATTSWGAYYIFAKDRIQSIRDGRLLKSYSALSSELQGLLTRGQVTRDAWIIEELLLGPEGTPARDLKVYTFYGRAVLALEIDRFGSKPRYCWWTRTGERVDTGKYRGQIFQGSPPDEAALGLAETMSLAVPAPFMRIDFLLSRDGAYFSEFTPRPGGYDGFRVAWDRVLGEEFAQAGARLFLDVRKGTRYSAFDKLVREQLQQPAL